jgi:hypothetical protein
MADWLKSFFLIFCCLRVRCSNFESEKVQTGTNPTQNVRLRPRGCGGIIFLLRNANNGLPPPPDNQAQATPKALGTRCSLHTTRSSPLAQPCLVQKKARWYAPSMATLYPGRPRPIAGDRPVQQIDICGVDYKTKMKLGSDYTHGVHAAPSSLRQALYLSLFKVLRRVRLQQLLILFSKYDQFK